MGGGAPRRRQEARQEPLLKRPAELLLLKSVRPSQQTNSTRARLDSSKLTNTLQIFDPPEWEKLLLKYIVPKLGETLRDEFKVNPQKQDMDPLNWVLVWWPVIGSTVMSQLLETEFFPKWLETVHKWLIAPNASFEGSSPSRSRRWLCLVHGDR